MTIIRRGKEAVLSAPGSSTYTLGVRVDGGPSNRFLPVAWRGTATASLLGLIVAFSVSSCGTTASEPAAAPASSNVLTAAELSHYPAGSVQRAFLRYWSALQYQSWAEVAAYYEPRFRAFMGTASVIGAKKQNTSTFPLLKPTIVGLSKNRGETTIRYTLVFADGTKEQASMTWRRERSNWQIIYDSKLDAELRQLAQNRVEIQKNGSLPTDASTPPSPAATRAANAAAQRQAVFLQQELKAGRP
jgi:hypothetical protein